MNVFKLKGPMVKNSSMKIVYLTVLVNAIILPDTELIFQVLKQTI